jgi:quercetin dioxygenase-like cupin family protein
MRIINLTSGDSVFVPQGEIHGLKNLSNTEPAEIAACYGRVGTKEEAGAIFVEP